MHGRKRNWRPKVRFANADGRLYRHLDIKLIIGNDVKKKRYTAAPGRGYTLEDIREACDAMIEELEKKFPKLEFREVCILPNAYNYIACEPKPKGLQLAGEIQMFPREVNDATVRNSTDEGDSRGGVQEARPQDRVDSGPLDVIHDDGAVGEHSASSDDEREPSRDADVSAVRSES